MWHSGVCFKRRYVMVYSFCIFGICRPFSVDLPAKMESLAFSTCQSKKGERTIADICNHYHCTDAGWICSQTSCHGLSCAGRSMPFIPGVMELRYVLNDGAAFSMGRRRVGARVPHRRNGPCAGGAGGVFFLEEAVFLVGALGVYPDFPAVWAI